MCKKLIHLVIICVIIFVILTACSEGGPEPGFDVTGLWKEKGGNSTLEFTKAGGYIINFDPPLSDGTTKFEGESYNRIDNSHLEYTILMGRTQVKIITVKATINRNNVLRFSLDGKTYLFAKAEG